MARLKPSVDVAGVDVQGDAATASLNFSWTFPGVATRWTYRSTAALRREDGRWRSSWAPGVLHPQLDGSNRLSQRRIDAPRGEMLGDRGEAIMIPRPVVRIGIDKTEVKAEQLTSSATRLARLVDIDARRYVKEVAEAGPEAFVEAIVLRATDDDRPTNSAVLAIPGALPLEGEQVLAPTREFARPILGTVGDASKEIVDSSGGAVVSGDQVGLSGLQRRYDVPLRGTPGCRCGCCPPKPTARARPPAPAPPQPPRPARTPSSPPPAHPRATGHGVRSQAGGRQGSDDHLECPAAVPRRTRARRHRIGRGAGGDPAVHRRGGRGRQQRRHRRILGGDRRPGPTRIDVQGGDLARPAAGRADALVPGLLPTAPGRRRKAVRQLQRLSEQCARRDRSGDGGRPVLQHRVHRATRQDRPRRAAGRRELTRDWGPTTTSASRPTSVRCHATTPDQPKPPP